MKESLMSMIKYVITILSLFALISCNHHSSKEAGATQTVIVSSKPLSTTLYYSGTLQPTGGLVLTAPADGVVQDMNFHYGDSVKGGQVLFTLSSDKFFSDYKTAVMQYIKAKNELATNQSQLSENEFLHKNQLISDDTLKDKQSSFYNARLSFLQAKDGLTNMLSRLDLKGINPYDLKIEEIDKITQALQVQNDMEKLKVIAPVSGVALLPTRGDDSDLKRIGKGESVKQGDVLALIGNLNTFRVRINVNEFNVNQLKLGQKVKVTSGAFPEFILEGQISGIDHQALAGQNSVPMFPVDIMISKLTPQEQAVIHVGMSVKVEVDIQGDPHITLPLAAVYEKQGATYVKVKDPKSDEIKEVSVKTGQTMIDSVVIENGLNVGDEVVYATSKPSPAVEG